MSRLLPRGLIAAAGFVAAITVSGADIAQAQRGPAPKWCVRTYDGQMDCAYFTFGQCQAAVSATGGDCAINPRFFGYPPDPYQPRRSYR